MTEMSQVPCDRCEACVAFPDWAPLALILPAIILLPGSGGLRSGARSRCTSVRTDIGMLCVLSARKNRCPRGSYSIQIEAIRHGIR